MLRSLGALRADNLGAGCHIHWNTLGVPVHQNGKGRQQETWILSTLSGTGCQLWAAVRAGSPGQPRGAGVEEHGPGGWLRMAAVGAAAAGSSPAQGAAGEPALQLVGMAPSVLQHTGFAVGFSVLREPFLASCFLKPLESCCTFHQWKGFVLAVPAQVALTDPAGC